MNDLKAYQREGGVYYFVVYLIVENKKVVEKQVYGKQLHQLDLQLLLQKKQKTVTIKMYEIEMVCRRTYYKTKKAKERTIKRYYICSLFNRSGSSACHSNAINAEVVERVINVHLNRILSQPDVIKQIVSNVIEELKQKHSN